MILTPIYEHSPSSELADIGIGEFFKSEGKVYVLLYRDPWVARYTRFTRFDLWISVLGDKIVSWLDRGKKK